MYNRVSVLSLHPILLHSLKCLATFHNHSSLSASTRDCTQEQSVLVSVKYNLEISQGRSKTVFEETKNYGWFENLPYMLSYVA